MCKNPWSPLDSSVDRIHESYDAIVPKHKDNIMNEIIGRAIKTIIVYHSNSCHLQARLPKINTQAET